MKKITFLIFSSVLFMSANAQSNETPLQNKNTKTNINTTNNNSNSGVNPNGNPGTIISSSAISGGNPPTNVSPYPVSSPSPALTTPVVTNVATEVSEPQVVEVVEAVPVKTDVIKDPKRITDPLEVVEVKRVSTLGSDMKVVNITSGNKQTFRPVYQTFIPKNIVEDIKKKYGDNVYDIILLNSKTGKQVYVVRVMENGAFRTITLTY
ncbi:MAG: hypothetical protein ABIP69_00030 [Ferruginibacter sp.]